MSDVHVPTLTELTPALLSAVVSAVVSLIFRFVPELEDWLNRQPPAAKQRFMLLVTLAIALLIGIYNMIQYGLTEQGVLLLALTIYFSLSSNQTTYMFIKRPWSPPPSQTE